MKELIFQKEPLQSRGMGELVFEVVQESDGGYCAECLTESVFTQADSWVELRRNVIEAVAAYHFDRTAPTSVVLRGSGLLPGCGRGGGE